METDIDNLPSGIVALHDMVIDFARKNNRFTARDSLLSAQIQNLITKNQNLVEKNRYLVAQLAILRYKYEGQSSEKVKNQISELELQIEENGAEIACTLKDVKLDETPGAVKAIYWLKRVTW